MKVNFFTEQPAFLDILCALGATKSQADSLAGQLTGCIQARILSEAGSRLRSERVQSLNSHLLTIEPEHQAFEAVEGIFRILGPRATTGLIDSIGHAMWDQVFHEIIPEADDSTPLFAQLKKDLSPVKLEW